MWLFYLTLFFLLALGICEYWRHRRNVKSIPIRVNINGVRGKSTVTRLITGILKEANLRTIGKTTGTSARMIYWYTDEEEPIVRGKTGANIGEQKGVVKKAADLNTEALVSECMAVNPDYQVTFQKQLLQANVGVIVNVLEDHMDVLGPTLDNVADAFTATIPENGQLIITDGPYRSYYERIAKERNTKVIVADETEISEAYLRQFEYVMFPANAAIALAVAKALDIDRETALRGMLNAPPDPGALRVLPVGNMFDPAYFINGFAANDAASTLNIWERVKELGYPLSKAVVIMSCRDDRVDRTEQFATDVLPYMDMETLVLVGTGAGPIREAYREGLIGAEHLYDLEKQPLETIYEELKPLLEGRALYGIGNIHGSGEEVIELFEDLHRRNKEHYESLGKAVDEVAAVQPISVSQEADKDIEQEEVYLEIQETKSDEQQEEESDKKQEEVDQKKQKEEAYMIYN